MQMNKELADLRGLGLKDIASPLQKVLLVGDRSSGKTIILEQLLNVPIQSNIGAHTRCPLKVFSERGSNKTGRKHAMDVQGLRMSTYYIVRSYMEVASHPRKLIFLASAQYNLMIFPTSSINFPVTFCYIFQCCPGQSRRWRCYAGDSCHGVEKTPCILKRFWLPSKGSRGIVAVVDGVGILHNV